MQKMLSMGSCLLCAAVEMLEPSLCFLPTTARCKLKQKVDWIYRHHCHHHHWSSSCFHQKTVSVQFLWNFKDNTFGTFALKSHQFISLSAHNVFSLKIVNSLYMESILWTTLGFRKMGTEMPWNDNIPLTLFAAKWQSSVGRSMRILLSVLEDNIILTKKSDQNTRVANMLCYDDIPLKLVAAK